MQNKVAILRDDIQLELLQDYYCQSLSGVIDTVDSVPGTESTVGAPASHKNYQYIN